MKPARLVLSLVAVWLLYSGAVVAQVSPCQNNGGDVVLTSATITSGGPAYGGNNYISASGNVKVNVGSGGPTGNAAVTFEAGTSICLGPGFQAAATSTGGGFVARIGPLTPPSITTSSLPGGTLGTAYSQTLGAAGGNPPYVWSFSSGSPPAGLTLNSTTGTISGTPTSPDATGFVIEVTDSTLPTNQSSTRFLSIGVPGITVSDPPTLPNGTQNASYPGATFTAAGGSGNYTWSISNGPAGLTINGSGQVTGTPSAAGSYPNFTVTARDAVETTVTGAKTLPLTVTAQLTVPGLYGGSVQMPAGVVGNSYSQALSATGGTLPYTWTSVSYPQTGELFPGVTITGNGFVSGIPQSGGAPEEPSIRVSDSSNPPQSIVFTAVIPISLVLSQTNSSNLPNAGAQQPYSATLNSSGGISPYTWSSSNLPPGIALTPSANSGSATLTGTPSALSGTANFSVTLTDADGEISTAGYSLTIVPSLQLTDLTHPGSSGSYLSGDSFSFTIYGPPNQPVYLSYGGGFTQYGGNGMTDSTGRFQAANTWGDADVNTYNQQWGVGGTSGNALAIVNNNSSLTTLTFQVNASSQVTVQLTDTSTGSNYQAGQTTYGNYDNFLLVVHGPPGELIYLNGSAFAGNPTTSTTTGLWSYPANWNGLTATTYSQAWSVGQSEGQQTIDFTLTGSASYPVVNPASLASGAQGTTYTTQTLSASQGAPPYTWNIVSGELPPGLTMTSGGVIYGTPAVPGIFPFWVTVTDANHNTSSPSTQFSITIGGALTISTTFLPSGVIGIQYPGATLGAGGGTGTYNSWTITLNSLPAGLSLNASTGAISGTPIVAGTVSVTFQVTDSGGNTAQSVPIPITIAPAVTTLTEYIRAGGQAIAIEQTQQ